MVATVHTVSERTMSPRMRHGGIWVRCTQSKNAIQTRTALNNSQADVTAARSAAFREETRGHMFRPEFPDTDDENWLCNVHARYSDGVITCEKAPVVTVED